MHTLRDAIDLARRLDIHVCMEINACWAERDLARTIADGIDRIGIVQVSDFSIGTLSTPNRLVPGDGDIPLRRIIEQVLDAGYEGVFDLELVGPKIEEEGYRSAIARSCVALPPSADPCLAVVDHALNPHRHLAHSFTFLSLVTSSTARPTHSVFSSSDSSSASVTRA